MAKPGISLKQLKIDKANSTIIGVTSATVFIVIFSLLACKSLLGQVGFNNRLATTQQTALNQLKTDVAAKNNLESSYAAFVAPGQNIIGGSSTATGQNDGNNAQIVLDALPSKYDFPALVTSMQNLLSRESVKIDSIGGTDEQLTQQTNASAASPAPVPIPISFAVDGPYQSIENVINDIQNNIRPIQIQSLAISGDESDIQLNVTAQTYYQPEKVFSITQETVQ
jgi:Tfp pilus assembly protein PilO